MQAASHGSKRDEAAESHRDISQTQLHIIPEWRTPGEKPVWSSPGAGDVVEGDFDMPLVQHKLGKGFHPSTKVKSQPSFFPGMHGDLSSSLSMCWAEHFQEAGCSSKTALHALSSANLPCKPGRMFSSPPCLIQRSVSR